MKIAIQGIKGSYHHQVATEFFDDKIQLDECLSFDKLVDSLNNGVSEFGVMAIENSIAGSIIPNYSLIDKNNLYIIGEYYININHNLMVYPGVDLNQIKIVSSHPMALLQCKDYLKKIDKTIVEDKDTAEVAKRIIENKLLDTAAIASVEASKLYGLDIIERNIQTIKDNETRFVVVSKLPDKKVISNANKASLKFILSHKNGSLANILNILSNYDMNLTKIQSIPIIETPWKYSFFIDTTFTDIKKYKKAIENVSSQSEYVKEFGVYENFKSQ